MFRCRAVTVGASGLTKFYLDENDSTVPTATSAAAHLGTLAPNAAENPKSDFMISWRAEDVTDAVWYSCASSASYVPLSLKLYTSSAAYGSSVGVSGAETKWFVQPIITFEFRGVGGN